MKVCLPQLVRTRGRCKSLELIASASLIRMKTTIASDVKIKSISPDRYLCIITQRWKCRLFERVLRSKRSSASVDELHGGKLSRTLAALF